MKGMSSGDYVDLRTEEILDKILRKAVKEYDSKNWYQKIRDYIKMYINILRL
ncbi:MAG: hypothetical protein V3V72_13595 [Ignavibacteriaceae bacterium]